MCLKGFIIICVKFEKTFNNVCFYGVQPLTLLAPYLYENAITSAKFISRKTQIFCEKYAKNYLKNVKKLSKNCFSGSENTYFQ